MVQTAQSWWFIFYKDQLLLEKKGDGKYAVPYGESSPIIMKEKQQYIISPHWKVETAKLSPSPLPLKNRSNGQ